MSTIDSSRRSKNVLLLWKMIILGHYKLSFLKRLSSSRRVLYRRFHCRLIIVIFRVLVLDILFRIIQIQSYVYLIQSHAYSYSTSFRVIYIIAHYSFRVTRHFVFYLDLFPISPGAKAHMHSIGRIRWTSEQCLDFKDSSYICSTKSLEPHP